MRYLAVVFLYLLSVSNAFALCFLEDVECLASYLLPGYNSDRQSIREWSAYSGFAYGEGNRIIMRVRFDQDAIDILRSNSDFGIEIEAVLKGPNRNIEIDHVESTFPSNAEPGWDTQVLDFLTNGSDVVNNAVHVLNASVIQKDTDYYVFFVFKNNLPSSGVSVEMNLQIAIDMNYGSFTTNLVLEALPMLDQYQYYALETDSHIPFTVYPQGYSGVCWSSKTASGLCSVNPNQCYASMHSWEERAWNMLGMTSAYAACSVPSGGTIVPVRNGRGPGSATTATDPVQVNRPNFIVNKSWLETVGGVEQYAYNKTDEIKMKAQFKNIGSGEIPNDEYIYSRAYLSSGYKEDDHSDWIRVGSDQTRGDSLDVGETHTETEGLKLWEYSNIKPGKTYNIVWCIDRTADDHNGSGDWVEEHESDNCSTPAVFTVNGSFNFTVTSLSINGGQTTFDPGVTFSADAIAYNAGDDAPKDTYVGYYLSGGDIDGSVLLGTDTIQEGNFTHGTYKSETLSNAVMPTTPGAYTLKACSDYGNRVPETNEEDNCLSRNITVSNPNPPPDPPPPSPQTEDDDDAFWMMLLLD